MSSENVDDLKERFTAFFHQMDTDKSGSLSLDEFRVLLSQSGYSFTEQETQKEFNRLDIDGDNTISLEEFVQAMTGIPMVDHRRAMWRKAFVAWDADNSGDIDREELKQVFRDVIGRELTDAEVCRVFERFDKNGNGRIEWTEFVEFFLGLSKNFL